MRIDITYNPQMAMTDLVQVIFYSAADLIAEHGAFSGFLTHGAGYRFDGFIVNAKSPGNRAGVVTIYGYNMGSAPAVLSYSIINDVLQNT